MSSPWFSCAAAAGARQPGLTFGRGRLGGECWRACEQCGQARRNHQGGAAVDHFFLPKFGAFAGSSPARRPRSRHRTPLPFNPNKGHYCPDQKIVNRIWRKFSPGCCAGRPQRSFPATGSPQAPQFRPAAGNSSPGSKRLHNVPTSPALRLPLKDDQEPGRDSRCAEMRRRQAGKQSESGRQDEQLAEGQDQEEQRQPDPARKRRAAQQPQRRRAADRPEPTINAPSAIRRMSDPRVSLWLCRRQ